MKLVAEIEVPDNCAWQTIEDAKLSAEWHRVFPRRERMKETDLTDKCGSCVFFTNKPDLTSCCYGKCEKNHKGYKQRSQRKCKYYERENKCTE